tara:strand:- start:684 stop:3965 length:3282 start_codon:yes stop_codon:yes gene_type:complete
MSRLIFKGDTIRNFGEFLPTPFIERVYVEDTTISVDLSLFVMAPEDEDLQSEMLSLTIPMIEYYLYLQPYLTNLSILDSLLEGESYTNPIEELINGDANILEYIALSSDSASSDSQSETIIQNLIDAWKESTGITSLEEDYTDSEGATWEAVDYIQETYTGMVDAADYDTLDEWLSAYYSLVYTHTILPSIFISAQKVDFDYSAESYESVYDDSGNLVLKLASTTIEFEIPSSTIEDWTVYEDVAVFAVSSTLPVLGSYESIEEIKDNTTLFNNIVGEVSYEPIFEGGEIVEQAEQIWVDSSGNPFDDTPLQEIMATYHKPIKITHKEIVDGFEELISKFGDMSQTDSTLESAIDGVSYVLAVYGTEPDLLPQLNKLRKAWPNKSSVTSTGKLYHAFKRALFNASKVVGNDPPLSKRLILNPKIIDQRMLTTGTWALRELYTDDEGGGPWTTLEIEEDEDLLGQYDDGGLSQVFPVDPEAYPSDYLYFNDTYPNPGVISAETFYTADQLDDDASAEGYGGEAAGGLKVNGFFFLDIEKLIARTVNIGYIYPPEKLDSFFGPELIQSRFSLEYYAGKVKLYDTTTGDELGRISMQAGGVADDGVSFLYSALSYRTYVNPSYDAETDMETSDSQELYSYFIARNFTYPTTADQTLGFYSQVGTRAMNEYRLLGLEFQMLLDTDNVDISSYAGSGDAPDWHFDVEIDFKDDTMEIYTALKENYYACYTGSLQEYYDLVSEPCNYNESDGTFNEFFIDGVVAAYEDNPGDTPWYRASYLYCLHRDLLFDAFGGDEDLIVAESLMLADKISPYAGTLAQVESFKTVFEALYDDYYELSAGAIAASGIIDTDHGGVTLDENYSLEISDIDFPYIYDTTTIEIYTGAWWAYFDDIDINEESTASATYTLYESTLTSAQLLFYIGVYCIPFFESYTTTSEDLLGESYTGAAMSEMDALAVFFGEMFVAFWNDGIAVLSNNYSDISYVDTVFEAAVALIYDDDWIAEWISDQSVSTPDKWNSHSTSYDEDAKSNFQEGFLGLFLLIWFNFALAYASGSREMQEDLAGIIYDAVIAGTANGNGAGYYLVGEILSDATMLSTFD